LEAELARLHITWRWGDTRRFSSNAAKIERRKWLIDQIEREKIRKEAT
jgi:hypothetical protein